MSPPRGGGRGLAWWCGGPSLPASPGTRLAVDAAGFGVAHDLVAEGIERKAGELEVLNRERDRDAWDAEQDACDKVPGRQILAAQRPTPRGGCGSDRDRTIVHRLARR